MRQDKVKYPKGMSRSFKDFLAGLLVKNPERRMTWPDLARHPFVCEEGDLTEDGQVRTLAPLGVIALLLGGAALMTQCHLASARHGRAPAESAWQARIPYHR